MSRVNRYEYKDWKNFGGRVKLYREQISLTKEKFADMINRSENYVSELEKGNTSCSVHTLYQISNALKISTDELLFGKDYMKENKEYSNKEILLEIIKRCSDEEANVLKDLIVATYPHLETIIKNRNNNK